MSDSESGDGMEELQAIVDEYAAKEKTKPNKQPNKRKPTQKPKPDDKPIEWIKSEEEIRLEKLIFGDKEGLIENLQKSSTKSDEDADESPQIKKRKPAWEDNDDNITMGEITKRAFAADKTLQDQLKSKFQRTTKTPKWADLDAKKEVHSDEEILQTVGFIAKSKSNALPSERISVKKLKDLNRETYAEGIINSIQFHPTSTVAMVSGENCLATLYAIDGKQNEKLHCIRFKDFPIKCARILNCGTKAMFASTSHNYYSYDLMQAVEMHHLMPRRMRITQFEVSPDGRYFVSKGNCGEMHLLDMKSKEFIHTFKQEDACQGIKFSADCTKIISTSNRDKVSIFDIRRQRVMHTFADDGCIKGQSLAISPDGKLIACGSCEGIVNIYDYEKVFESKTPKPLKTIMNLTTKITGLNFNHSSEILGLCSGVVKGGMRLCHIGSGTVFANFPGNTIEKLPNIRDIQFSPSSGYIALQTWKKEAPLYRLKHFSNY
ncbi:U3 small nucleolar RNA-associated protein 18 homolog [Episyrphus balteatus]|uniref:U3 small nucleolar RNA-associated protein 18 homolog n=1 Tax=Episyrphus balteatus TaxID=286459 RepID=UPI002486B011|nr:U3 small nucleolar RNA-associated protein 18 homolog [Episyrphus balteatus]